MSSRNLAALVAALPPHLRTRQKEGFNYSAVAIPLAVAPAVVVTTVTISGDSDFWWGDITGVARDPAAIETIFPAAAVTIMVNDSGSGRNILQSPQDWVAVVGTAERPGEFMWPYLAERGGQLTVTFTNLAAQAYDIRLALRGVKIYGMEEHSI